MKIWARRISFFLALGFLVMTFVNASWIAPAPRGYIKLIAVRGVHQLSSPAKAGTGDCTARRIEPPMHDYLENSRAALDQAARTGAQMIAVDVVPTKDGGIALFQDADLACRTNGKGNPRRHSLAELKALDAGYGYTADGGKSFPLRGTGLGAIPSLAEALAQARAKPLLFSFTSDDPAEADQLAAALKVAGRDVETVGDGFIGPEQVTTRIKALFPKAWTIGQSQAQACTDDYRLWGWLGVTPDTCRGATVFVPLNRQWAFAGWPNRMIARMEAVGARMVITGPASSGGTPIGLALPEQLGKIPAGYNGYVWVDDIWAVGPAFRPDYNRRTPPQEERLQAALERRRAERD